MNSYSIHFHLATKGHSYPQGHSQKRGSITVSRTGHCCSQQNHLGSPQTGKTTGFWTAKLSHNSLLIQKVTLQPVSTRETGDKKKRHFGTSWRLPGKKLLTFYEHLTPKSQTLKRCWWLLGFRSESVICPQSERQLERAEATTYNLTPRPKTLNSNNALPVPFICLMQTRPSDTHVCFLDVKTPQAFLSTACFWFGLFIALIS